jgi:hypothetical protein
MTGPAGSVATNFPPLCRHWPQLVPPLVLWPPNGPRCAHNFVPPELAPAVLPCPKLTPAVPPTGGPRVGPPLCPPACAPELDPLCPAVAPAVVCPPTCTPKLAPVVSPAYGRLRGVPFGPSHLGNFTFGNSLWLSSVRVRRVEKQYQFNLVTISTQSSCNIHSV